MERVRTREPAIRQPKGGGYSLPGLMPVREASGMSREELAERAGLTRVTIWNLETGKRLTKARTVYRLAEALDAEPLMLVQPGLEGEGSRR